MQHPISSFPEVVDVWLLKSCPIEWVVERIKDQYGLPESDDPPMPKESNHDR